MERYTALIVAAGSGSRMGLGYNKLLYTFASGQSIIEKTADVFLQDDRCHQIIMVISKEDEEVFHKLFAGKPITFTYGGATRMESVYHGLQLVKEARVLIHDGARPWLEIACINRILRCLEQHPACLLMVQVKDTIKEVKDGKVIQTLKRKALYQAQTPQAFHTTLIRKSYEQAMQTSIEATDDAQIVELFGDEKVWVVEGSYDNIKVTTKEDLIGK